MKPTTKKLVVVSALNAKAEGVSKQEVVQLRDELLEALEDKPNRQLLTEALEFSILKGATEPRNSLKTAWNTYPRGVIEYALDDWEPRFSISASSIYANCNKYYNIIERHVQITEVILKEKPSWIH